jgi:hypothetical protein
LPYKISNFVSNSPHINGRFNDVWAQ